MKVAYDIGPNYDSKLGSNNNPSSNHRESILTHYYRASDALIDLSNMSFLLLHVTFSLEDLKIALIKKVIHKNAYKFVTLKIHIIFFYFCFFLKYTLFWHTYSFA